MSRSTLVPLHTVDTAEPLFPVDPASVITEPPSLQPSLRAAALLWCTHSTWPTVRAIAGCAGIAASSVLWPYGTIEQMRRALIHAERKALSALVTAHGSDLAGAVGERVAKHRAKTPG